MWQRLKCKPTQYGDNKNTPGGRFSNKRTMREMLKHYILLQQAGALKGAK
jgi:hypothetical protein